MNKQALKEVLLNLKKNAILKAESNYNLFLEEVKHDWTGVEDADDHSHVVEGEAKTLQLESQVMEHKRAFDLIDSTDFEPMTEIDLGAIVKLNEKYFVVSAAEPKFDFDGKTFMGISVSAPIYNYLRGKKVGDEFTFNKKKFVINKVL